MCRQKSLLIEIKMVRNSKSSSFEFSTRFFVVMGILAFAIIVGTIIGSSYKDDFVIDDVRIVSIPKHTNIQQFNGFISVAIRTDMDTERKQKLKEGLWKAIHNPEVREKLKSYFVMPDESDDMKTFNKFIQTSRVTMRKAIQP